MTCYVENDTVFSRYAETGMLRPAVLIHGPDDMILKYGDYDKLLPALTMYTKSYQSLGEKAAAGLQLVALDALSAEKQCYVINRMMNYTSSGFVTAFSEHIHSSDCMEWLNAEIERVPIDLEVNKTNG